MAKRLLYNVGIIMLGADTKNLFIGDADGQSFLAYRIGERVIYVSYDYVMTMLAFQKAILDKRVDVTKLDNESLPEYTEADTTGNPAVATGLRKVAVTNLNSNLTEMYLGAPYFSLKGDTVSDYENNVVYYATAAGDLVPLDATTTTKTASPSVTGIALVDDAIAWGQNNIILVLAGGVAFYFWDPFDWFKPKKKKGKK